MHIQESIYEEKTDIMFGGRASQKCRRDVINFLKRFCDIKLCGPVSIDEYSKLIRYSKLLNLFIFIFVCLIAKYKNHCKPDICCEISELSSWNLLTRTNNSYEFIRWAPPVCRSLERLIWIDWLESIDLNWLIWIDWLESID